jgi:hypothetical protein
MTVFTINVINASGYPKVFSDAFFNNSTTTFLEKWRIAFPKGIAFLHQRRWFFLTKPF